MQYVHISKKVRKIFFAYNKIRFLETLNVTNIEEVHKNVHGWLV